MVAKPKKRQAKKRKIVLGTSKDAKRAAKPRKRGYGASGIGRPPAAGVKVGMVKVGRRK